MEITPPQRRVLVACGAGTGLAAAYNVPFGGALFALEVLLGELSISLVPPALAATLIVTTVSWVFLSDRPTYTIPAFSAPPSLIAWALVVRPWFGQASAGYIRVIGWAGRVKPHGWLTVALPVIVFAVLGGAAAWFPQLLGNCKSLVQSLFSDQTMLICSAVGRGDIGLLCMGAPNIFPRMTSRASYWGWPSNSWNSRGSAISKSPRRTMPR